MAYTTINKSTSYFNTKLWTGNGSAGRDITGIGFQPDWVWIKNRSRSSNHTLVDVLRGSGSYPLSSSSTAAQDTGDTNQVSALISDGFTVGSSTNTNANSENLVGWSWKAGGSGSSNTDGTINTTSTSANTTSGISIITYTGTGSNATIGHGLGAAPKAVIIKKTNATADWLIGQEGLGGWNYVLNFTNSARADQSAQFQSTAPSSSVITLGTDGQVNASGDKYVCYAFAEKTGFSKFGSYTGNGDADGTFVYTGFKPAFVIIKLYSTGSENWRMFDNKRIDYNPNNYKVYPSLNNAEGTSDLIDLYSNGFKPRTTSIESNGDGNGYSYMAFGQTIVSSGNIIATAR